MRNVAQGGANMIRVRSWDWKSRVVAVARRTHSPIASLPILRCNPPRPAKLVFRKSPSTVQLCAAAARAFLFPLFVQPPLSPFGPRTHSNQLPRRTNDVALQAQDLVHAS